MRFFVLTASPSATLVTALDVWSTSIYTTNSQIKYNISLAPVNSIFVHLYFYIFNLSVLDFDVEQRNVDHSLNNTAAVPGQEVVRNQCNSIKHGGMVQLNTYEITWLHVWLQKKKKERKEPNKKHSMVMTRCGVEYEEWVTSSVRVDMLYSYQRMNCTFHSSFWTLFTKPSSSIVRKHILSLTPVRDDSGHCHGSRRPRFVLLHFWAGLDASVTSFRTSIFPSDAESSVVDSFSPSLEGNSHAKAAPAVPSPLWREKQRKVAQTNAQQPVKVVLT